MNTFPLIKTKITNEHIMAGVFLVLILYHLPLWFENPSRILRFLLLVGFGLFIDTLASILRYKRVWCCVSGAVTAAIISLIASSVPLWGQLTGVAVALILGKHLLGGTGKNFINPALTGVLFLFLYFGTPDTLFSSSWLTLPAIVLGLVFLTIRPYAGISFILGMLAAMDFSHELTISNILAYGVLFWGSLVLTDPVTVTRNPTIGSVIGFLAGLLPLLFFHSPVAVIGGILLAGPISVELTKLWKKPYERLNARTKIPKVSVAGDNQMTMIDLTGEDEVLSETSTDSQSLTKEEILKRVSKNGVFGMGGAAFSTSQKLRIVIETEVTDKHLIINAVECDPGLIHDKWILQNCFAEIAKGAELLHTCVNFKSAVLVVKDKNGLPTSAEFKIQQVPDRYPVGAEKILIEAVLKQCLSSDQIPAVAGILVLNIQTVYAVYQAVLQNRPVTTRYVTVANLMNRTARVVKVTLNRKLPEIMAAIYPGTVNIFAGGGIMQSYLAEDEAVVDHKVNFIAVGKMPDYKESPQCSKCGECNRNCPAGLPVKEIADLVDRGRLQDVAKYRVKECLSCGSCSYFCLAGRNLSARIKKARDFMSNNIA